MATLKPALDNPKVYKIFQQQLVPRVITGRSTGYLVQAFVYWTIFQNIFTQ